MVVVVTKEGNEILIKTELAFYSDKIKHFKEDERAELNSVRHLCILLIIEYLEKYHEAKTTENKKENNNTNEKKIRAEDVLYNISKKHKNMLLELLVVSYELKISFLMDAIRIHVADIIKGMDSKRIGETLGIENDLSPAEKEKIQRENRWCEEF